VVDTIRLYRTGSGLHHLAAPAGNPYWPDAAGAAEALMTACTVQFGTWGVTRQHAGGELPVPGVYGVPE